MGAIVGRRFASQEAFITCGEHDIGVDGDTVVHKIPTGPPTVDEGPSHLEAEAQQGFAGAVKGRRIGG
jgi:hypothetical protein